MTFQRLKKVSQIDEMTLKDLKMFFFLKPEVELND